MIGQRSVKFNLDYIAGFIDGEGCISADKKRGLRLIVTNCRKEILEELLDFFNTGRITEKIRAEKEAYKKKCFQWICWNRHAEKILREIESHLILKKEEAKIGIRFMETFRKHGAEKGNWGVHKLPNEIWKERELLVKKLQELKWQESTKKSS